MVRISDARMSGTSYGACVLHVAPESFVGGPLALVRDGDVIELDVPAARARRCSVDDDELARAPRRVEAAARRAIARGYGALFAQHVTQADEGCDFDFLERRARRSPEPGDPLEGARWNCPTNHFKRAHQGRPARRSACGAASPATSAVELARRRRASTGCCSTPSIRANELPMVLRAAAGAASAERRTPSSAPPWNDTVMIKRLLDVGAQTLLIPYVQTEEEAQARGGGDALPAARACAASPRPRAIALRPGQGLSHAARARRSACCVQVETSTRSAISRPSPAVEGVDGVFIGPGDLSAAHGPLGQPGHPEVDEAVRRRDPAHPRRGKAPGILTGDEELARRYIEAGGLFAAVGSDTGLLVKGSEQLAQRFKGGA